MGRSAFFLFFNIYYLDIEGNGKKKSQILKKKNCVAAKQASRSVMPKNYFFIFGPVCNEN